MYNSLQKHLQRAIAEVMTPQSSQNTKKTVEVATKKEHKHLQTKEAKF